jgi:hypothetical protein
MKQRTPMSGGTGFARKTYVRAPQPLYAKVECRSSYSSQPAFQKAVGAPKTVQHRHPHLLSMARGQSCLLLVPGICNGDRSTVVAAHSNLSIHGKAGARKADDQYHVYACFSCHQWLDQGGAPAKVKTHAFMQAHLWMVDIWRGIVAGFVDATPKDKAAAQWALDRLNATPVGQAA